MQFIKISYGLLKKIQKSNQKVLYKTKFLGEKFIKESLKNTPTNYAILRYFSGWASDRENWTSILWDQLFKNLSIASIKVKPKINIYGKNYKTKDKTCIRDYIHVSDIAKIYFSFKRINKKSIT